MESLRLRNNCKLEIYNNQSTLHLPKKRITFIAQQHPDHYKLFIKSKNILTYTFKDLKQLNSFYKYTISVYLKLYD